MGVIDRNVNLIIDGHSGRTMENYHKEKNKYAGQDKSAPKKKHYKAIYISRKHNKIFHSSKLGVLQETVEKYVLAHPEWLPCTVFIDGKRTDFRPARVQ